MNHVVNFIGINTNNHRVKWRGNNNSLKTTRIFNENISQFFILFYQKQQTIHQYLFLWVAFAIDCNMKWSVDVMAALEILLSDVIWR